MKPQSNGARRRLRFWKSLGMILGGALLLLAAFLSLAPVIAGPWLDRVAREKIREIGYSRFSSTIEVERVRFSLVPPSVSATGILFRHNGRSDVPPLLRIRQMDIRGGLTLLQSNPRASSVRLQGLEIVVPRRRGPPEAKLSEPRPGKGKKPAVTNFSVSEIVAEGTVLQVLSKKPGRDPLRPVFKLNSSFQLARAPSWIASTWMAALTSRTAISVRMLCRRKSMN